MHYKYAIEVEEHSRPCTASRTFKAQVRFLPVDAAPAPHVSLGEVWGRTRESAAEELRKRLADWVTHQNATAEEARPAS